MSDRTTPIPSSGETDPRRPLPLAWQTEDPLAVDLDTPPNLLPSRYRASSTTPVPITVPSSTKETTMTLPAEPPPPPPTRSWIWIGSAVLVAAGIAAYLMLRH